MKMKKICTALENNMMKNDTTVQCFFLTNLGYTDILKMNNIL